MALGWGLSIFAANAGVWEALPTGTQAILRDGVAELERRIWTQAEADTARGLDCNTGAARCEGVFHRRLTLVGASPADEAQRRRLLADVVLPRWIERCGDGCVTAWNEHMRPATGLEALAPSIQPPADGKR